MILDARSLPDRSELDGDLCILGAGPAGIAIAREFLGTDVRVIVIEAGGERFDHRGQLLYRGLSTGHRYLPLEFTRRRQLGGSSVVWSGRCRPLDAFDFSPRPWVPHSGWGLNPRDLDPYYKRAHRLAHVDTADYSPGPWGATVPADSDLEVKMFHFSPPTNFAAAYRPELEAAANIRLFLHAIAVNLAVDGGAVRSVECRTLQGRTIRVHARRFVLALGGLENPRLLLASHDLHPEGIGNEHGLVGRFFMDHPYLTDGVITEMKTALPPVFLKLDFDQHQTNLGAVAGMGLREPRMAQEQLLNAGASFVRRPLYKLMDSYFSRAMADLIELHDIARHASAPSMGALAPLARAALRPGNALGAAGRVLGHKRKPEHGWGIRIQLETAPNLESRVALSRKRDALGMPMLSLHWQRTAQDLESYRRFRALLFEALPQLGIEARPIAHDLDETGWPVTLQVGKHHIGTTRMHTDPRHGVVDLNCRVHSISNLYVGGSSVFPTSGMANPTLTILALAVRLADHLKSLFTK